MNSTAVLARTNLALRPIEAALADAGVKYFLIGRSGFWSAPEVRSILSYLGCVVYPADWLIAGAIRASFFPSKFLPKTKLLAALKKEKDEDGTSYWQALTTIPPALVDLKNVSAVHEFTHFVRSLSRYKDLPADEALKHVIQTLKAVEYFRDEEVSPDNDPVANLSELVKLAARYQSIKEFMDYTRRASAASKGRKGVAVSTIHGAKGLEFHTVFLIGCQEGLMPHSKATDLEEERAIFFVGASRAERELKITFSGNPSPFLNQKGGIINPSTTESK
jgi:DNA helicase-2/ATP-dependent DNA helicase PcrA